MTEEKTTNPEYPLGTPIRQVAAVNLQIDKIDEIASYLSAIRGSDIYDTNAPFVVVPEGMKVLDLESLMPRPRRIRHAITFIDVDSFTRYFQDFRVGYLPRLFGYIGANGLNIVGVIDYDVPAVVNADQEGKVTGANAPIPAWNSHIAHLELAYHRDYATLKSMDGRMLTQQDFALFVEENLHLFQTPDSATMLEIAQELKGARNVSWKAGKRLSNGQVSLEYNESTTATTVRGHELEVPEYLVLTCPVYEGFPAHELRAAFRWHLSDDGKVSLGYRLLTKLVEREAEEEVKHAVIDVTQLPILAVKDSRGISNDEF